MLAEPEVPVPAANDASGVAVEGPLRGVGPPLASVQAPVRGTAVSTAKTPPPRGPGDGGDRRGVGHRDRSAARCWKRRGCRSRSASRWSPRAHTGRGRLRERDRVAGASGSEEPLSMRRGGGAAPRRMTPSRSGIMATGGLLAAVKTKRKMVPTPRIAAAIWLRRKVAVRSLRQHAKGGTAVPRHSSQSS